MHRNPILFSRKPHPQFSVEQWQRRISTERSRVCLSDDAGLRSRSAGFQNRFGELSRQAQKVLANGRLKRPEWSALSRLSMQALMVLKWIDCELRLFQGSPGPVVSPGLMDELLQLNEQQFDRLQNQLWLFDCVDDYVGSLRETMHALLHRERASSALLQNLARRIGLDVGRPTGSSLLMPDGGPSILEYLSQQEHDRDCEPVVYSRGIETARLLSWTTQTYRRWLDRQELLAMAALLQDIGLLSPAMASVPPAARPTYKNAKRWNQHPLIGAALASGIDAISIDLPSLIAQHHERIDGTGIPHGLHSPSLSDTSRLLSIAVRYVDLLEDFSHGRSEDEPRVSSDSPDLRAAVTLYREAERGEWDVALTIAFLESHNFHRQRDTEAGDSEHQPLALSPFGEKRLRRDGAHGSAQSESAKRTGEDRHPLTEPKFLQTGRRRGRSRSSQRLRENR